MKPCRYCAEEIQDAAILCRFCGKEQTRRRPEPESASPLLIGGIAGAALLVVAGLLGANPKASKAIVDLFSPADSAPAAQSAAAAFVAPPPPPPPPPPLVQEIASSPSDHLEAGNMEWFTIKLDDSRPCRLTGHIEVLDGGSRDVSVYVVDEDGLANLRNGHQFNTFFQQERTSAVTLDLPISGYRTYYLVVSNQFSAFTHKDVAVENVRGTCGGDEQPTEGME